MLRWGSIRWYHFYNKLIFFIKLKVSVNIAYQNSHPKFIKKTCFGSDEICLFIFSYPLKVYWNFSSILLKKSGSRVVIRCQFLAFFQLTQILYFLNFPTLIWKERLFFKIFFTKNKTWKNSLFIVWPIFTLDIFLMKIFLEKKIGWFE